MNKIYRSRNDRMLAGVCGGLGEYFGIDSSLVRLALVLLIVFGGTGFLAYLIAWVIIPEAPESYYEYKNRRTSYPENEPRRDANADEVKYHKTETGQTQESTEDEDLNGGK